MSYQVEIQMLPTHATAVVEGRMPVAAIPAWLPRVYQEIVTYLTSVGVGPAGPPFARYTFQDDFVTVQAGFPVAQAVAGEGRVAPSSLPGGPAAVTTHYGPYEGLTAAYDAVEIWLKENGREGSGPPWEVYYTDPQAEPDPAGWRTDVVQPVWTEDD